MKNFTFTFMYIAVLIILSGCINISEEDAKKIVIDYHDNDQIGDVKIIKVNTKFNRYIIEWENKKNCERGIDRVNKQGEIKEKVHSIC